MLTITKAQMLALERAHVDRMLAEYLLRLRAAFPEASAASKDAVRRAAWQDMADASRLGIEEEGEVWRYLCLRYRMGPLRGSALHLGVVAQVLQNLDWPPAKRLAFVDRYVLTHRR